MHSEKLIKQWTRCEKIPFGKLLFSKIIALKIPYTGSIPFRIMELKKGECVVQLKECRKIKNHLNSIHAIALANLAEFTSGLTVHSTINQSTRGIPFHFEIEYFKKSRGIILARSEFQLKKELAMPRNEKVVVELYNEAKEMTARATATWKISAK